MHRRADKKKTERTEMIKINSYIYINKYKYKNGLASLECFPFFL